MACSGPGPARRGRLLGLLLAAALIGQAAAETPTAPDEAADSWKEIEALLEGIGARFERIDEAAQRREDALRQLEERLEAGAGDAPPEGIAPPAQATAPAAIQAALAERDARIRALEGEIAELRGRLVADVLPTDGDARLVELEQELAAARAESASLEMRLSAALEEREALQRDLEGEAARARELEDQLAQARARLAALSEAPPEPEPATPFAGVHDLVARAMAPAPERFARLEPPGRGNRLEEGQFLMLGITAPERPSYLTVDYFKADGRVVHLRPSAPGEPLTPGRELLVGDPFAGASFQVAAPFGEELILAVASPVPLFEDPRPEIEDAGAYLTALEQALAELPSASRPMARTIALETVPAR